MVYKLFDKKTAGSGVESIPQKEQLADELHKPIIRKLKKKVDWAADLADMQLISKCHEGFRFLLCLIDIYSKYAWVVPLKDKKGVFLMHFKVFAPFLMHFKVFDDIVHKHNNKKHRTIKMKPKLLK